MALFILLSLLSLLGLFARLVIRNFVVIMNQKNSKYRFSLLSHSGYENRLRGYLFFSGSGVNSLDSALYLTGRVKEVVISLSLSKKQTIQQTTFTIMTGAEAHVTPTMFLCRRLYCL